MSIKFKCLQCEKPLTAPDHAEGKVAPCPKCGHRQQVPLAAIEIVEDAVVEVAEPVIEPVRKRKRQKEEVDPTVPRVPCPNCRRMILHTARVCRYCRESTDGVTKSARKRARDEFHEYIEKVGGYWKWIGIFTGAIGCLVLFLAVQLEPGAEINPDDDDAVESFTKQFLYGIVAFCFVVAFFECVLWLGCAGHQPWALYIGLVIAYLLLIESILSLTMMGGTAGKGGSVFRLFWYGSIIYNSHLAAGAHMRSRK